MKLMMIAALAAAVATPTLAQTTPAPMPAPDPAMAQPAPIAIFAAISLVFIPPLDKPELASPAIASMSAVNSETVSNLRAAASSLSLIHI